MKNEGETGIMVALVKTLSYVIHNKIRGKYDKFPFAYESGPGFKPQMVVYLL